MSSRDIKSRKIRESDNEDCISNLPECLVAEILSCLSMECAVQTSILSKDWRYKWTSLGRIKISNTIVLCCSTLLKCSLLRELELKDCTLNDAPQKICFPRLTNLCLVNVRIMNDDPTIRALEFSFPMLITFELNDCYIEMEFAEITAPMMDSFIYEHNYLAVEDPCIIQIIGERITQFRTYGLYPENLRLPGSTISTLDYANVHINDMDPTAAVDAQCLLKQFAGLRQLKIHYEIAQAIADLPIHSRDPPVFNKLELLELTGMISNVREYFNAVKALFMLLNAAPFLEYLIISIETDDDHFNEDENGDLYDYDAVEPIPSCLVSHLKEIEFSIFYNSLCEVHLARFLLKNALRLKKFCVDRSIININVDELRTNLYPFPRASVEFAI